MIIIISCPGRHEYKYSAMTYEVIVVKILCKYTRNASYVDARAAPENSFDAGIKGACQARDFPYISRDVHLG